MYITHAEDLLQEAGEAKHKADWIATKIAMSYPKNSKEMRCAEELSDAADKLYYHFLFEVTGHGY